MPVTRDYPAELAEIQRRSDALMNELDGIAQRVNREGRKVTDGEKERMARITRASEKLDAETNDLMVECAEVARSSQLRERDMIRRAAAGHLGGYATEGGASGGHTVQDPVDEFRSKKGPTLVTTRTGDPWAYRSGSVPRYGEELRQAALHANEVVRSSSDFEIRAEARERIEDMITRNDKGSDPAALWVLASNHPNYLSAFEKLVRNPGPNTLATLTIDEQHAFRDAEIARTALSLTGANGGYLVPQTLDPSIVITNSSVVDPIRGISTIKQISTDDWSGVTSAGVTAEWLTEGSEFSDASPTFTQPVITPKKAGAYLEGSYEVLADSQFVSDLSRLLADAKTRLEAAAFATGNTGASQPRGVIAGVAAVTASLVSSASISALVVGDVYRVQDAVRPRDASQMKWISNKSIMSKLRQFDTAGGSAFWANLGMSVPAMLLGDPIYECSTMVSAVTTSANVLLAGDFSAYYIVDRIGMTVLYEPMVKGSNRRPVGRGAWAAFWRVGADVVDPDAFRLLQLHTTPAFTALG